MLKTVVGDFSYSVYPLHPPTQRPSISWSHLSSLRTDHVTQNGQSECSIFLAIMLGSRMSTRIPHGQRESFLGLCLELLGKCCSIYFGNTSTSPQLLTAGFIKVRRSLTINKTNLKERRGKRWREKLLEMYCEYPGFCHD